MPNHASESSRSGAHASSDADIYLDVVAQRAGKIRGEGVADGHVEDIQLHGWHWGVAATLAMGVDQTTSRRQFRPLVVVKGVDASSTGLLNALATNDELKQVTLTMRKSGGELEYFKMVLGHGRVADVDIAVDETGRPVEHVTIAFLKIEIDYKRQQADGSGSGAFMYADELTSAQ